MVGIHGRTQRVIMQGTLDCALRALSSGTAMNIAGGTHHAFADHAEGFCILNDFAGVTTHDLKGLVSQY